MIKLKEERLKRGLMQNFVADKIGLRQQELCRIEKDPSNCGVDKVNKVASYYGLELGLVKKGSDK